MAVMTDTIPSVPASNYSATSYLNHIKGQDTATGTTSGTSGGTTNTTNTTPPAGTTPATTALSIPSQVLSLVQGVGGGSFNSSLVSSLLGNGLNGADPLASLFVAESVNQPLQDALNTAKQLQSDNTAN